MILEEAREGREKLCGKLASSFFFFFFFHFNTLSCLKQEKKIDKMISTCLFYREYIIDELSVAHVCVIGAPYRCYETCILLFFLVSNQYFTEF